MGRCREPGSQKHPRSHSAVRAARNPRLLGFVSGLPDMLMVSFTSAACHCQTAHQSSENKRERGEPAVPCPRNIQSLTMPELSDERRRHWNKGGQMCDNEAEVCRC